MFTPINLYRMSRWFYKNNIFFLARVIKGLNFLIFNCVIPPQCIIGEGTKLFHSGLGIIIHPSTVIGKNCNIYNFIVIGGGHDGPGGPSISIIIGDNCNISSGSKILCKKEKLTIGNNCTIAANSVVISDFPDNVIVGGLPAKILKQKNS